MDSNNKKTIVWFRRDLRIEDNPALSAAAREGSVLPVYIWCPKEEGQFYPGRVSRWWLKHSLTHLRKSLKSIGGDLVCMTTHSTLSALLTCIHAVGATKLVFNHLYDPVSLVRDHQIKEKLLEFGISVQSYNADLLHEPWEVYDEKGETFRTFDAYWENCMYKQPDPIACSTPGRLLLAAGNVDGCSIEELDLEDESEKSSNALLGRGWSPGWSHGDKALTDFIDNQLVHYAENMTRVGGNSTSLLSPHLHFGEVSVRKLFQSTQMKQIKCADDDNDLGIEGTSLFLRAIGFREYSRYVCFNFPFTHERSLLENLKFFPWRPDQERFKAWRQGRTGYPLVDAGMRELWATGWIHNRVRVIVSSFSVKFLLLPWKWGMKYFWDTLLDADLESDILGWQYISGSLPDGHELERMDCPELQGSKYDPKGEYVRQWLPELTRMPTEWIHHPWDAPTSLLKASGVELGSNYPLPIVDFDTARANLTQAILKMWETEAASRSLDGSDEVVGDNATAYPDIPKAEQIPPPCLTQSSNDQRVPSFQNAAVVCRKRQMAEEVKVNDEMARYGASDLRSTAESSSSSKKQSTSRYSFSVPHTEKCCSSSTAKPVLKEESELELSETNQPWQEEEEVGVTDKVVEGGNDGTTSFFYKNYD